MNLAFNEQYEPPGFAERYSDQLAESDEECRAMAREGRDAEHRQLHPAEGEVGDGAGVPEPGDPGPSERPIHSSIWRDDTLIFTTTLSPGAEAHVFTVPVGLFVTRVEVTRL